MEYENNDIKLSLGRYNFTLDDRKYTTNYRKHGVKFETAAEVFLDDYAIELVDKNSYQRDDEERIKFVGMSIDKNVLVVIFVERYKNKAETVFRIISARKAVIKEVELYERRKKFSS